MLSNKIIVTDFSVILTFLWFFLQTTLINKMIVTDFYVLRREIISVFFLSQFTVPSVVMNRVRLIGVCVFCKWLNFLFGLLIETTLICFLFRYSTVRDISVINLCDRCITLIVILIYFLVGLIYLLILIFLLGDNN